MKARLAAMEADAAKLRGEEVRDGFFSRNLPSFLVVVAVFFRRPPPLLLLPQTNSRNHSLSLSHIQKLQQAAATAAAVDATKAANEDETTREAAAAEEEDNPAAVAAAAPAAPTAGETAAEAAARELADSRSVYIGSIDYSVTPEELQAHFQGCGAVNRVTIPTGPGGQPKGFAYLEFCEADAVANALLLDCTPLKGREIRVNPKRTNVPGLRVRGGGVGGGRGGGGRGGRGGFRGGRYSRGRGRGRYHGGGY